MYKIVLGSSIIDVVDDLVFVCYDTIAKSMMRCKKKDAQGILSSDSGVIWHLDGYPEFGVDGYETVSAISISATEGQQLREQLSDGEVTEPEDGENPPQETAMSIQEMRVAIIALQKAASTAPPSTGDIPPTTEVSSVDEVWNEMAAAYEEGVQSA